MGRPSRALALLALVVACLVGGSHVPRARAYPFSGTLVRPASRALTLTTMGNITTTGGLVPALGTNFNLPTVSAHVGAVWVAFPTSTWTSTSVSFVVPPIAAGTYDVILSNADGSAVPQNQLLVVTATQNPSTIFGANLVGQWVGKNATCSGTCVTGSVITAIPDTSGLGNNLTGVGSGLIYNAASAHYRMPNVATFATDGSASYFKKAAFNLNGTGTIATLGAWYTPTAPGTSLGGATSYGGSYFGGITSSGFPSTSINGSINAIVSASATSAAYIFYGADTCTSSAHTLHTAINNGVQVTATGSAGCLASGQEFDIGASSTPNDYEAVESPETIAVNIVPTTLQLSQVAAYMNLTYGVTSPPTFVAMSVVQPSASGSFARVTGTGFMSGVTVSASGGVGTLTAIDNNSTIIDVSVPSVAAGTNDITITNLDGRAITITDAMVVSGGATPASILGPGLVVWHEDQVTLNGSNASAWKDESLLLNDDVQATALDQPAFSASCAVVNGLPCLTSTGSPIFLRSAAAYTLPPSCSAYYFWSVVALSTTTGTSCLASYVTSGIVGVDTASGIPNTSYLFSPIAVWGSSIGTSTAAYIVASHDGTNADGATGTFAGQVNVNNGSAVRGAAQSGTPLWATSYFMDLMMQSNSTNFMKGSTPFFAFSCQIPTSGEITAMNTYVQKFGAGL